MKEKLHNAKIINGKCEGRTGKATASNKYGNVMFYPDDGNPYRICKDANDVEFERGE